MRNHFTCLSPNILAVACLLLPASSGAADCPQFLPGWQTGTVENGSINEASGLVASRKNLNVLWVHNDSGDPARVFAMNTGGDDLGIYNISGAGALDWEDIAIGPGPVPGQDYLYLGDIGDNFALRAGGVKLYRVPEPAVDPDQEPVNLWLAGAVTITLQYPDGPRDAEALMVDPANGDIYVVSKRESKSRVYLAAYPQAANVTMQFLTELPWGSATGGEISPLGTEVIIRRYSDAWIWTVPDDGFLWDGFDAPPCTIPVVAEPQGEAICFDAFGFGYFTVSEGLHQPIYSFERLADAPVLSISVVAANVYRLLWDMAGFYDLEFDTSPTFDNPDVTDITGLTEWDYPTVEDRGFFRLVRR